MDLPEEVVVTPQVKGNPLSHRDFESAIKKGHDGREHECPTAEECCPTDRRARRTVVAPANNLGVSVDLLYRWRREQRANAGLAFPGHGREALSPREKKIRELEKKLKDVEMKRDILKKAMAIFSRAPR